jgi:hypothetical protein
MKWRKKTAQLKQSFSVNFVVLPNHRKNGTREYPSYHPIRMGSPYDTRDRAYLALTKHVLENALLQYPLSVHTKKYKKKGNDFYRNILLHIYAVILV